MVRLNIVVHDREIQGLVNANPYLLENSKYSLEMESTWHSCIKSYSSLNIQGIAVSFTATHSLR